MVSFTVLCPNGEEMQTMAVSGIDACNNIRYARKELYNDLREYKFFPTVGIENRRKNNMPISWRKCYD